MARYEITAPDGSKWEVTAPEGATQAQVLDYAKQQWQARKTAEPEQPSGTKNNTLAAQVGLTARAGLQGLGGLAGLVTDPIGGLYNAVAPAGAPRMLTARGLATKAADAIGLPTPDTPTQRAAAQGVEMMSGAGGAGALARGLSSASTGATKAVSSRLADDPLMQVVAAGGGGAAGQQAKESGATATGELISALTGTLLAGGAVAGGRSAVDAVRSAIPNVRQQNIGRLDQIIDGALQRNSIDPASIDPAMRRALQDQVAAALKKGPLDADAVARLADYTRLGMTPTRARLTLDPYDVTREQNASRMAAALGATDAKLPAIAQANNRRLLGLMDDMKPSADTFGLGETVKRPIVRTDAALKSREQALYKSAEQVAGGDIPLERGVLNGVYDELSKARKLRFLPAEVSATIDDILKDTRAPFTVNEIDALKSTIATAQRGTADGNVKQALKIVRDYLDGMPLNPEKRTFGGNQIVTEAGAKFLRDQDALAGKTKEALDKARQAAFERRRWQESAPIIEDALNDATGETFIRKHVLSPSAGFADLSKAVNVINRDPAAKEAIRSAIVQHLKDAAIGKGNQSATGNFSGRGWASALESIGDRKLGLFFDKPEIEQLKSMGRVGTAEVFQPRGSAVNNSNTAAGVAGLLQGLSKYVKPVASKVPLGQELLSNPIDNITLSVLERGAGNVPNALLMRQAATRNALDPFLFPALLGVGSVSK